MFTFVIYFIFSLLHIKVESEIAVLAEGINYFEEDDIALIFFITVKNICKDDLELSVNMVQCCETISSDETDCNSMMLIGGDMGILSSTYVKNLTLIYPNLYLSNRRGVCTVTVTYRNQFKKKGIITDIHFDTTKSCPGKPHSDQCPTTDLDSKANCNPVDCLIKYSGTVSYFNPECKRCQKVPSCNSKIEGSFPDVAYSPYSNECIDLNVPISKKDLEEIENNESDKNQTTMINAICHYGKVTETGECLCHDEWTTATNDEGMYEPGVAQHHMCNIHVGDWHCVNKGRIRITTILIAVFAVTVISKVLLLMCLMTWCYRHFRKPEKMCARELDPDDKSIILCEDFDSFDKCICCEATVEENQYTDQSKQKPKTLHSQTVSVSYYPSSPSAFSSIKASTGSSKFTINTEPTIDLSNTTSSAVISFPEGGSSDESQNTDDSGNDEDRSNDIAYGVYCSIDELEGEEEEDYEEEVEEEEEENSIDASQNVNDRIIEE